MNLNKLFPRLSIRAKLIIAFAGLAALPLIAVSAVGTAITIRWIRDGARATLTTDLEKAEVQTARLLREAERHVEYLTQDVLGPALLGGARADWPKATEAVRRFLGPEPAFHEIRVVDLEGQVVFASRGVRDGDVASGAYYAWRAAGIALGTHDLFPVEVMERVASGEDRAVPAVAILVPVRDLSGAVRGAVVGEAYASALFAAIETSSPGFEGTTALVDANGAYLFHSARKRSWSSRLAAEGEVDLTQDLGAERAARLLGGGAGAIRTEAGELVGFRPLALGERRAAALTVYRAIPLARLERPVRRFLLGVAAAGLGIVGLVLWLGVLAADQFALPIYRVREAVRAVAAGGSCPRLAIETNDEIEDLALDVQRMSGEIATHREVLERLVADRTAELAAAHAQLSTVLDGSADAIVGLDALGRVRLWNRGAAALFGWSEAEALGEDLVELIGPSGPAGEHELAYIRDVVEDEGAIVGFQTARRTREGDALPVSLTQTSLCDSGGAALGSSLVIRDNRMQARLDDHMRRSERLAAVSVMAAGLAHEIRNPLGIIANRIEIMQRDAADRRDAETGRDLDVLAAHVERLRSLTTDLLRFARDDDDSVGPVRVDSMTARLVSLLQRTFVARHLDLAYEPDGAVPSVTGSERALETVIMNLLLNAADATPAGGRVSVAVRPAAGRDAVEIAVRDTGTGIAPEVRGRIFEPFFTTKGPRGGTGLGLAVCRSVVDRHGGAIRVDSAPGAGTTFTVTLPCAPLEGT